MTQYTYITGGQRSGKSLQARTMAEAMSPNPVYLATARRWDTEFEQRIQRHQQERGDHWTTIEEAVNIDQQPLDGKTVLLDCVTLWLTNIFHDNGYKTSATVDQAKAIWDRLVQKDMQLIVVSNEIGMGVIPANENTRKFADVQGWVNQYIAQNANVALLMVSGIPLKLK